VNKKAESLINEVLEVFGGSRIIEGEDMTTPDFEAANKASWQDHSHEFLLALHELVETMGGIAHNTERIADKLERVIGKLDARQQWNEYQ